MMLMTVLPRFDMRSPAAAEESIEWTPMHQMSAKGSLAVVRHNLRMLQHCLSKQTLCRRGCRPLECQDRKCAPSSTTSIMRTPLSPFSERGKSGSEASHGRTMKASISNLPDRKKLKNPTLLYLHVSRRLISTRYS
jgi:hypothetical protein